MAEKKELTPEEKAAELETKKAAAKEKDAKRLHEVTDLLTIGQNLKGDSATLFFKSISGKPAFQLTEGQWNEVIESKKFKPAFLEQIRKDWNLDRKTSTYVPTGGAGRAAGGESVKRAVDSVACDDNGAVKNAALHSAGNKVGEAIDALMESFKGELSLMHKHGLMLKTYVRRFDPNETKKETTPATA